MRVYVAAALVDAPAVRAVQDWARSVGHEVVHDWTSAADAEVRDYLAEPDASARIASTDLRAVLEADLVVVLATGAPARGLYVELGAALACVERGEAKEVVVVGEGLGDSVFFQHPAVQRAPSVEEWWALRVSRSIGRP